MANSKIMVGLSWSTQFELINPIMPRRLTGQMKLNESPTTSNMTVSLACAEPLVLMNRHQMNFNYKMYLNFDYVADS